MSFFARGDVLWYSGDNLPGAQRLAIGVSEMVTKSIASALNSSHVDVEMHNGKLRIVGPGVE